MNLNARQKRTLGAVYADPVRSNIPWSDIEALFSALGAVITEGSGSRIRVLLNGVKHVFHRPHPERVTDKGAVKSVRQFLLNAEIDVEKLLAD